MEDQKTLTQEELAMKEEQIRLENEDRKQDAQRRMAWVALFSMIFYPVVVLIAAFIGIDISFFVDMSDVYFIAVAGIVAAFYGKEAYMSRHG